MKLDLEFVRSQFPAFSKPALEGWAFFENTGGSYPCVQFINRLTSFYMKNKVQVNYPYPASRLAGRLMEASYKRMADYLNVEDSEIHFGPSTTQNVYATLTEHKIMLGHKVRSFLILHTRPLSPLKGKTPAASALGGSPLQGS